MAKDKSRNAETPTAAYRLMFRTIWRALGNEFGREKTARFSRAAGLLAGNEFACAFLDLKAGFRAFTLSLQKALMDLKVDTLRIESNPDTGNLLITLEASPDDDGLSGTQTIYIYDEGFVDGILEAYSRHSWGG